MTGIATGAALPEILNQMSELEVTRHDIELKKLPKGFDGLKIVQLSDLHNKVYGNYNIVLYEKIAAENPDIVIMTGDMVSHGTPEIPSFLSLVQLLGSRFPLYYVNGNHELSDMDEKTFRYVSETMEKAGAVCLDNDFVNVKRGGGSIHMCGLCYPAEYYRGVKKHKRSWKAFKLDDMINYMDVKPDDFTVLLAHNPLDFDVYAKWGADISFGGHIHGGFIRLPFVKGIISPELKLLPKYKEGVYNSGDSVLVVSRGLGRIRIFNRPEIVSVTLHCGLV